MNVSRRGSAPAEAVRAEARRALHRRGNALQTHGAQAQHPQGDQRRGTTRVIKSECDNERSVETYGGLWNLDSSSKRKVKFCIAPAVMSLLTWLSNRLPSTTECCNFRWVAQFWFPCALSMLPSEFMTVEMTGVLRFERSRVFAVN